MTEVDLMLEEYHLQTRDSPAPEDDAPPPRSELPPICKPGDLWLLGEHQLLCGDARDEQAYQRLLDGEKAQAAFTDPPYNVRVADVVGRGQIKHSEFSMASGEMSVAEYTAFLTTVFRNMAANSESGAVHFICTDAKHLSEMTAATAEAYNEHLTLAVWNKVNPGLGGLYRNQHELVFVEKVGAAPITNNVELGRNGRNRSNLWTYRGLAGFGRDRHASLATHPTMKPVALVADAIIDVTKRNRLVLDPFAGSGTTVIAAEKTGRAARVLEIDPHYCDVIIRRWQTYAGTTAIHARSRTSFEDVEAASAE